MGWSPDKRSVSATKPSHQEAIPANKFTFPASAGSFNPFCQHALKRCLSDLSGTDVVHHNGSVEKVFKELRDFLKVEAGANLPGATQLQTQYEDFLGWMTEKKIYEGHTQDEALQLPTKERLDEMKVWVKDGCPPTFVKPV